MPDSSFKSYLLKDLRSICLLNNFGKNTFWRRILNKLLMCHQPLQGSTSIFLALIHPEHSFVFYGKFLQLSVSWLSPATGLALCKATWECRRLQLFQSHDRWESLDKYLTGETTLRNSSITERSQAGLSSRCLYSPPAHHQNSVQLPPHSLPVPILHNLSVLPGITFQK